MQPISCRPAGSAAPLALPPPVSVQAFRAPKKNIPQTAIERNHILQVVRHYVTEFNLVPPQPAGQLKEYADRVIGRLKCDAIYRDYIGVLINNEIWREPLASVPYERRLLLLPKCPRVENKCSAPFDEFGPFCKQCGLCSIQDLQFEAERLGYVCLVAESPAVITSLIQTGKIEAIVGVSCLSGLERAFPYLEAAAIPGVAIPLLQDDGLDATIDPGWIWDYIHLTSDDQTRRLDLGALRGEVDSWFMPASLDLIMGPAEGETERIARDWLMRAGKRWRPFLTVSAFQTLRDAPGAAPPGDLRKIAVAVECFHKASLVHDDIEDNDAERYGEKTLHEEHGLAVALNAGDLLIGEAYRLIAASKITAAQKAEMLAVAATGQRQLCRGQGAELCWTRSPAPLSSLQVLDIFRQKTAPAFEVALQLGALYAGVGIHAEVAETLSAYSGALGIAYQIRDDLSDLGSQGETNDIAGFRPSLLLAVAHERADLDAHKALTGALWHRQLPAGVGTGQIEALYRELKADERAKTLLETFKEEAIRSLRDLENPNLKGLLRRVLGKIFNDTEIQGWGQEFGQKNGLPIPAANSAGTAAPVTASVRY